MNILVGFDGSNAAHEAVSIAMQHAKAFNARVEIVTSLFKGTENDQKSIQEAERGLSYVKSVFDKQDIECNTHLLIRGMNPGEDLVEFAHTNKIDQIVIGVKRRSKVGKILMGSTAQFVIIKAQCPVVAVK